MARLLKRLPSLAEDCGFKRGKSPSQPTINRFKHRIGLEGFRCIFKLLVKAAKGKGVKASWVAGDAIHDNRETRSFLKSIGARAFIDHNPRGAGKGKAKPMSNTYRRMKTSVERVFSRAKGLLGLDRIRVRGFDSVSIHVHIVFIAMLSVAIAANGNGLDDKIRCIRTIF